MSQESRAFETSLEKLRRLAGPDIKPIGTRVTAERNYGQTYQAMVRKGTKPQIRLKYRYYTG